MSDWEDLFDQSLYPYELSKTDRELQDLAEDLDATDLENAGDQ